MSATIIRLDVVVALAAAVALVAADQCSLCVVDHVCRGSALLMLMKSRCCSSQPVELILHRNERTLVCVFQSVSQSVSIAEETNGSLCVATSIEFSSWPELSELWTVFGSLALWLSRPTDRERE